MMAESSKVALIAGITGQDGAYLARLLLGKGYVVHGTSRDAALARRDGLIALGISNNVKLHSMSPADLQSVAQVVEGIAPDEIYNLSGQSSVSVSFTQPAETLTSVVLGTLNMLELLRRLGRRVRFYNAGSSECFGDTGVRAANEQTAFRPKSPYGVAKAASISLVANYREAYGLFACSGVLFNHESPLRPMRFVSRKITAAAARIGAGSRERLALGNLSICRDWGWAPDYDVADAPVRGARRLCRCFGCRPFARGVRCHRIRRVRAPLARLCRLRPVARTTERYNVFHWRPDKGGRSAGLASDGQVSRDRSPHDSSRARRRRTLMKSALLRNRRDLTPRATHPHTHADG
jgi:GDPmannose 4,6-dehydratase